MSVSLYRQVVVPPLVTAWLVNVSTGATQFAVSAGSPVRVRVAVAADTQ